MDFNFRKICERDELTDDFIIKICQLSHDEFGGTIYVPCNIHPCGWDELEVPNPKDLDSDELIRDFLLEYKFECENISGNIYDNNHPFIGKTLREILMIVDCKFIIGLM